MLINPPSVIVTQLHIELLYAWLLFRFVSSGRNNVQIRRRFLDQSSKLSDLLQSYSNLPEGSKRKAIKEGFPRSRIKEIVDTPVSV